MFIVYCFAFCFLFAGIVIFKVSRGKYGEPQYHQLLSDNDDDVADDIDDADDNADDDGDDNKDGSTINSASHPHQSHHQGAFAASTATTNHHLKYELWSTILIKILTTTFHFFDHHNDFNYGHL